MAARRGTSDEPRFGWSIRDLLARVDLVQLLDEHAVPATHNLRARRWHCPSPDHEDRRASVSMRTDHDGHERWRCWSCEARGDAIDLVMISRRVDRRDALETLATRAGLSSDRAPPPLPRRRPPPSPKVVPLDPSIERYARACERILHTAAGKPVRDWLTTRGIGPEVARANHLGADPGRNRLPRPRGLPYGADIAATFPALDQTVRIRYVQARYLNPGDGDKYDNPARRLGSNPRISWTIPIGDPRPGVLVVTEGIPDGLTAAQAGYRTAAVLGSQAPDATVAARLATRAHRDQLTVVAVTDNDDAGHRWGQRLADLLADHDQDLMLVRPAVGDDLNSWARLDPTWTTQLDTITRPHLPIPAVEATASDLGIEPA